MHVWKDVMGCLLGRKIQRFACYLRGKMLFVRNGQKEVKTANLNYTSMRDKSFLVLSGLLLISCGKPSPISIPSEEYWITINLQSGFREQYIAIEIDGVVAFGGAVTTHEEFDSLVYFNFKCSKNSSVYLEVPQFDLREKINEPSAVLFNDGKIAVIPFQVLNSQN